MFKNNIFMDYNNTSCELAHVGIAQKCIFTKILTSSSIKLWSKSTFTFSLFSDPK